MINKRKICLVLIGICFLVYANSLNNVFLIDDIPAILENPQISQIRRFWLDPTSFLNSLNYLIGKENPFIYHFTNIILHSINTILVFVFLNLFFKTKTAFLGGCLFAVHPIHTEAVTWISGRPYLILALFIFIPYFLYQSAACNNFKTGKTKKLRVSYYLLSLFIFSYFIIQHLSFYFIFPFFLALSDITFKRWKKTWKLWIPFFAIVILRFILAKGVISNRTSYMVDDMGFYTAKDPLIYFVYSFYSHLGLLIWPAKLTLFHEPIVIPQTMLNYSVLYFIAVILSLLFTFKKTKEIFFGLSIFIIFLAPTFSPVPIASLLAERYVYFPSIALSIFIAFLYEKYVNKYAKLKKYFLTILILIILGYAVPTVIRNQDWKSPIRFWQKAIAVSPRNWKGYDNLGFIYLKEGNIEKSIEILKKAIEINPRSVLTYNNLAVAYNELGDKVEAINYLKKVLEIDPNYVNAYNNLGRIYIDIGNNKEAVFLLKKAVEIDPYFGLAHFNLCIAYSNEKEYNLAIKHCDEAIKLGYNIPDELLRFLESYRKK